VGAFRIVSDTLVISTITSRVDRRRDRSMMQFTRTSRTYVSTARRTLVVRRTLVSPTIVTVQPHQRSYTELTIS